MIDRRNISISNLLYVIFFCTYMSQCPPFFNTPVGTYLQLVWVVTLPFFINGLISLNKYFKELILSFLFIVIMQILSGLVFVNTKSHFDIDLLRNYIITFYMVFVGAYLAQKLTMLELYQIIRNISIIVLPIICVSLYVNYFKDFNVTSRISAYYAKNSIALILFTNILFIFFDIPKTRKSKIINIVIISLSILTLFYLRSRATLLCLLFVLPVVYSWKRIQKNNLKYWIILLGGLIVILYIFYNEKINFIINNFLFAGRESSDINDLSSGRIEQYQNVFLLKDNIIFGLGTDAPLIDCFYLYQPLVLGIPSFIFTLWYMYTPVKASIYTYKYNKPLLNCFLCILLSYYFDGVFEGVAPLGPGVRCFMLWFLTGFILVKINLKSYIAKNESLLSVSGKGA